MRPQIIAHRGHSGKYAESTRAAYMSALDLRVDGIEADVHLTRDGTPVIAHDFGLERVTGKTGQITDHTLSALRALNFSSWHDANIPAAFGALHEQLLTLPELLDMVLAYDRPLELMLELKHPSPVGFVLDDTVLRVLDEYGYDPATGTITNETTTVTVTILSFLYESCQYMLTRGINAAFLSPLFHVKPEEPWELKARDIALAYDQTIIGAGLSYVRSHEDEVRQWIAAGREVSVWVVNTVEDAQYLHDLGVQYVTTNHPDILLSHFYSRQKTSVLV